MSIVSESTRAAVTVRAQSRCEYCRLPTVGQVATFPIDHIQAQVLGGATELSNLALACPHCNAHKWRHASGIDQETGQEETLFNPRVDQWTAHFGWSDTDSSVLVGKTPRGRATIARLQMNHGTMIHVRQLLMQLELLHQDVS